jgi:hypothetical protein
MNTDNTDLEKKRAVGKGAVGRFNLRQIQGAPAQLEYNPFLLIGAPPAIL